MTTPEERVNTLRARLSGQTRSQSRADKQLELARPTNLMFGVALHAAARLAKGSPLSSFEQKLVDMLRTVAEDNEIAQYGEIFTEAKKNARNLNNPVLPEAVMRIQDSASYSDEDFLRDARELAPEIAAMPNNAVVDLADIPENECVDSPEYSAAIAEAGTGTTIFSSTRGFVKPDKRSLTMHRFKCHKASGDGMFNTKDEIYWATAAGADSGKEFNEKTMEFGSVKSGTVKYWDIYHGGKIFGDRVEKRLAGHIEVWEADDSGGGFYNSLRNMLKQTAEACIDTAVKANDNDDWGDHEGNLGSASGILALVALVGGLVNALLGLVTNDDDLVCKRTYAFDIGALDALIKRPDGEMSMMFDGGGQGKHELWIRCQKDF